LIEAFLFVVLEREIEMSGARLLRTRMAGPLEPYVPGFAVELVRDGYVARVVELHVRLAAHLSGWLDREGLGLGDLTPEVVERYFAARRAAGFSKHWTSASLRPLLGYLRSIGAALASVDRVDRGPVETLLERYGSYLRVERRLDLVTIDGRSSAASCPWNRWPPAMSSPSS
jgi:hypothetical protein